MKTKYTLLFLIILLTGCRESFMPAYKDYQSALVVEGMITNQPGPYTVKLSKTQPLGNGELVPYSGCSVQLLEKNGKTETLTELDSGIYRSTENGIQGEVGKAYRITITTPQGNFYQSDFEKIRTPTPIDSVYARTEYHRSNNYPEGLPGYQFYIDTKRAPNDSTYIYWKMSETYEYTSDFQISAVFRNYRFEPFPSDSLYRCYKTQPVKSIFTSSTSGLNEARVERQPLHFVGTDNRKLMCRYSLLVKQLTISEDCYRYWENLSEQLSEEDFLFGKQPYQIQGNVYNPDNPREVVRGYFVVGGVDHKRIFLDPPKVDFLYPTCALDFEIGRLPYLPPSVWPVYLKKLGNQYGKANEECFDCRLRGGTLDKPEFWDK